MNRTSGMASCVRPSPLEIADLRCDGRVLSSPAPASAQTLDGLMSDAIVGSTRR